MLKMLIDAFHSIPDVIWSGVIASILTLGGVFLSNNSNTKRLLLQLKHDSEQKEKERTAKLRQDTYLSAAEETTKAIHYLTQLPILDLGKGNIDTGLQNFNVAMAKLQLVAEPSTALLVNQYTMDVTIFYLEILAILPPFKKNRTETKDLEEVCESTKIERNRILAEMTKYNETTQKNPDAFSMLSSGFDFNSEQIAKFNSRRNVLAEEFSKLYIDFLRKFIPEMRRLGELQIPVLLAIRKDLDLTGDIDIYSAQLQSNAERVIRQLEIFIDKVTTNTTLVKQEEIVKLAN